MSCIGNLNTTAHIIYVLKLTTASGLMEWTGMME